jgi:ElaB/YqjD/DUF883 family membrane-anchored ribosome-binding protein
MDKSLQLDQLVSELETALARLPCDPGPELLALRQRVDDAVLDAWPSISRQRVREPPVIAGFLEAVDAVVRSRPLLCVGVVALAAVPLGTLWRHRRESLKAQCTQGLGVDRHDGCHYRRRGRFNGECDGGPR